MNFLLRFSVFVRFWRVEYSPPPLKSFIYLDEKSKGQVSAAGGLFDKLYGSLGKMGRNLLQSARKLPKPEEKSGYS